MPVTLDLSKAVPIGQAPPNGGPQAPVSLDMTKAQPIGGDQGGGGLGDWARGTFTGKTAQETGETGINAMLADQEAYIGGGLTGAVKSGGRLIGSVLDMIGKRPAQGQPDTVRGHIQDAADWLHRGATPEGFWENVGATGEQLLEYLGTDGLLRLAGGAIQGTAAAGKAVNAAQQLKAAQQTAEFLAAHPKIAGLIGIGLKATKDAATIGTQTYLHTEDPGQAALAAGAGGLISAGAGAAQRYITGIAPRTVSVGGVRMPALASQVNEAGLPLDTGARGAPAIAQAQQRGGQTVLQNTAGQATVSALESINRTRPVFEAMGREMEPGRLLPAPEGAEPFQFRIGGAPAPTEARTGEILHPAEEIPRTHTTLPADRTGKTAYGRVGQTPAEYFQPGGPEGGWAQARGDWAERRIPGYANPAGTVEGAADVARGGGVMQTTDPMQAEGWLRQIEDLQGTREFSRLPEGQQQTIEGMRHDLNDQLRLYYNSNPYAQRFAPIDSAAAAQGVRTFGDAATQVEAAAKPVYETLDRASGGEFNKWKEVAKRQLKLMRNPSSEEAFEGAQAKYNEAQGAISDLIDRHRGQVSMQDYLTAKSAWRDGSRLDELHGVFEGMMNGVTAEESEQGLTRIMTGRAKTLERYLSEGTNREQIERLIGTAGLNNLKQITLLLSRANTARATQNVASNVAFELSRHIEGGGWAAMGGALAGGAAAHAAGLSPSWGALGGAIGIRVVLREAATNPTIGRLVEYAARNGLSAQHYAPLIARSILAPFQQPAEEEGEK